jgi:hypothetical protein
MSLTSSQGSAALASDSSGPECEPSRSARLSHSLEQSCESTGPTSPAITTSTTLQQSDWLETELVELTLSAGDIPASPSPTPASSEATKILATSGRRCAALLAKSDPLGSLLKMLLVTSRWGSTRCSLTWKPMATPGGRLLFRLVQKTPPTSDSESGSWLATATATANQLAPSMMKHKGCRAMWPTPRNSPASIYAETPDTQARREMVHGKGRFSNLADAVQMWPTPTSRDHKDTGDCANVPTNGLLGREVGPSKEHGSLNPQWVEWLMGFPDGWTDLKPSEMPLSRRSLKKLEEQSYLRTVVDEVVSQLDRKRG